MTHLSDFSYLQRVALEIYMGLFLLYRVWSNERFRCLHPKRIFNGELKSIITVLYLLMLLMQGSWDAVSTWIKYKENFFFNPLTQEIINKPFILWTPLHQHIAQSMDYVECVNLSMQTSIFFLMQCFWNYLCNSVAKKTFMNSWEFRFYIIWAIASAAVFPILQWRFREDVYMRETVPQFAYSVEVLITAVLGIRSHMRFRRIINISRNMKHGASSIVEKLMYFKDMNAFFTVILFIYGFSLGTLCVDGFTTAKTINSNKFASDLLIANCNTAAVLMWIVGISIFHPRDSRNDSDASSFSKSIAEDTEHNTGNRVNGASEIGTLNNGQRLSQRITNFIVNKNNGQLGSTIPTSSDIYSNSSYIGGGKKNHGSSFMRPMSPVQVDYPPEGDRMFTPTSHFTNPSNSVSVEDPYTNQSISFAMMEPTSKRYNVQPERSGSPFSQQGSFRKNSGQLNTLSKARTNDVRDPLSNDWLKQSPDGRI